MWNFFLQALPADEPLLVPDSVQKANLAQTIDKVVNMDYREFFTGILNDAVWILLKLLLAVAIYMIGRWIVRRIVQLLDVAFERRKVDISLRMFVRNAVKVVFTLLLILIVVQTLAIGMALSGTAQNFAGGVMILVMKPYRVGDFISAQGQSGTVREIKLFSTVITTGDNQTIYIPNNAIATAIIDNYSTADLRRVDWTIGISYGDDVDAARKALLEILASDTRILAQPAPVVWVAELADSAVNLTVRAWTRNADYWDVFFQNNERFYKRLPEHGINFPFPQVDLHLKQE